MTPSTAAIRSVAHGYPKTLRRAACLISAENQHLWSTEIARTFAETLRAAGAAHSRRAAHHLDQDGRVALRRLVQPTASPPAHLLDQVKQMLALVALRL